MHLPFPFLGHAGHPHVPPDTTAHMGRPHVLLAGPATLVPVVRSALATEAPHVDATDTAWLGRALAARYAYDLIIVDRPSDAQGRSLCGRIRAAGIAAPILLLGTGATSDSVVCGLAAGADAVLQKPVALARLRAQLLALLHQRGRAMVVVTDPRGGTSESDDAPGPWHNPCLRVMAEPWHGFCNICIPRLDRPGSCLSSRSFCEHG